MAAFLQERQVRGDAPSTRKIRAYWLEQLAQRGQPWEDLGRADLERWQQELLWQPGAHGRLYSRHTVEQALTSARLFLRWAHARGALAADPMAGWRLGRTAVPPRALLSREEVLRLMASPGADPVGWRDRALLELLGLGLAPGACAALDLADLDRSQGLLRYPGRQETLRLSPSSREHLERYLLRGRPPLQPAAGAFFVNERGERLTSSGVSQRLRQHARAAGLRVTAHQLARSQAQLRERFLQRRLFPLAEDR